MDARLLDYYNRELSYLRELGGEFARQYPKVAGRLGMDGVEVADPYVERLMEGFSFLTARIHMKMDAEFPRFCQRLLDVVHPNYLAPTPSMAVVQFDPSMNEGSLAGGFALPAGTELRSHVPRGEQTASTFVTGHDVMLWPLQLLEASFTGIPADLPLAQMGLGPVRTQVRSALRLRLSLAGGSTLESLDLNQLVFHLAGQDGRMHQLLEALMCHTGAVVVHDAHRPVRWHRVLRGDEVVRHEGFDDSQALLPVVPRTFQGYRLLQEYFAFPSRFLFFSLNGLTQCQQVLPGNTREFEITVLLTRPYTELEGMIEASDLALHCTPVINLFRKRTDRIPVSTGLHDYHVVVDRTRPMDYEVHSLQQVRGHASGTWTQRDFRPFYGTFSEDGESHGAYYTVRREPRLLSDVAQRHGARTSYLGSEVHVALVDQHEAPFPDALRHLSVEALCSNRDLPLLLARRPDTDFTLRISAPVGAVRLVRGPSRPRAALGQQAAAWGLVSQFSLNHLDLSDLDATQGAATLRELLGLYGNLADPVVRKQIEGVRHVRTRVVHRRWPGPGPAAFQRGVAVDVTVDEGAFSGISPFLFGALLHRYLARHVSINHLAELTLATQQRGDLARWAPRPGRRPVV